MWRIRCDVTLDFAIWFLGLGDVISAWNSQNIFWHKKNPDEVALLLTALKPWYIEPQYNEFHDIVNKTQLLFCGFTKHITFDIVNCSIQWTKRVSWTCSLYRDLSVLNSDDSKKCLSMRILIKVWLKTWIFNGKLPCMILRWKSWNMPFWKVSSFDTLFFWWKLWYFEARRWKSFSKFYGKVGVMVLITFPSHLKKKI